MIQRICGIHLSTSLADKGYCFNRLKKKTSKLGGKEGGDAAILSFCERFAIALLSLTCTINSNWLG